LERLFIGIGLVMLVAGLAAIGLGLPYIVLERGFTQVIVGTSVAASGVVLTALGIVLRDVRSLRSLVSGLRASAAVDASARDGVSPPEATASSKTSGLAVAGASAAALAGGIMLAAGAKADDTAPGKADGAIEDVVAELPENLPALAAALPSVEADDLSAKIDMAVGDLSALRSNLLAEHHDGSDAQGDEAGTDDHAPAQETAAAPATHMMDAEADDAPIAVDADQGDVEAEEPVAAIPAELETEATEKTVAVIDDEDALIAPAHPVASDEGIVGVHTVGASTFTMYSDGTIRAETPEGPMQFPDVAALKLYLAGERAE
jgi:hypothetical protein